MNPYAELSNLIILSGIVLSIPWLALALVPPITTSATVHMPEKDSRGRYAVFDIIRGIAIIAVIVIHVSYFFTRPGIDLVPDSLSYAVNAVMRFTIPIFLLTSGLLLKPPSRTLGAVARFYMDKALRIGVPYVLVCITLALALHTPPKEFINGLYTGTTSIPFYFVIVLFQLYLVYPFIATLAKKRWFIFATLAYTLLNQVLPFFWSLFGIPTFFQYLFFFVWGIYMRDQLLSRPATYDLKPWFVMIGLFLTLYTMFPGEYYNIRPYYGLAVFMVLFAWLSRSQLNTFLHSALASIGRNTLWIFLLHFPLMQWMMPVLFTLDKLPETLLFTVVTVVSIVTSIGLAYVVAGVYGFCAKALQRSFSPNNKNPL